MIKKKIRKSVSCEQGFTLIELLIVIVIIGIMLGVSVVAYVTSMGNADARGAAEMLKQDFVVPLKFCTSPSPRQGLSQDHV